VQLSEEGERKLADDRMKEWSKDQEEYTDRQFREIEEKKKALKTQAEEEEKKKKGEIERIRAIKGKYSEQAVKLQREHTAIGEALEEVERMRRKPEAYPILLTRGLEGRAKELEKRDQEPNEERKRLQSQLDDDIQGREVVKPPELEDPDAIRAGREAEEKNRQKEQWRSIYKMQIEGERKNLVLLEKQKESLRRSAEDSKRYHDNGAEEFNRKFPGAQKKGEAAERTRLQSDMRMHKSWMEDAERRLKETEEIVQRTQAKITSLEEEIK
jgi:hypothetical protein